MARTHFSWLRSRIGTSRDVGRGALLSCGCRLRYLRTAAARRPQVTTPVDAPGGWRRSKSVGYQVMFTIQPRHAAGLWQMDPGPSRPNHNANAINHWDSNAARGTRGVQVNHRLDVRGLSRRARPIHDLVTQACAFINYARGSMGGRRRIESGRSDPAGRSSPQPQGIENAAEFVQLATKIPVICLYDRRLRAAHHPVLGAHETRRPQADRRAGVVDGAGHCRRWMMLLNVLKPTGIVVTWRSSTATPALYAHRRPVVSGAELDVRAIIPARRQLTMGQACRDRCIRPGCWFGIPGALHGHAGEPGRGLGVGGVRGGRLRSGQAGGHLDRGPDHQVAALLARRRRAVGDFRRQHLTGSGVANVIDRSDQQGAHLLSLGLDPGVTSLIQISLALRRAAH